MNLTNLRPSRWALLFSLFLAFPLSASTSSSDTDNTVIASIRPIDIVLPKPSNQIDLVRVIKSQRKLQLISNDQVVHSYRVSLGKKPLGHKEYEGDQRTPEGTYTLDWRKPSDNYQLSMHIDYPNSKDRSNAEKIGRSPGGMIMLHGTPIDDEFPEWFFNTLDWTNGCIALTNTDMRDIWERVEDGTTIEILP